MQRVNSPQPTPNHGLARTSSSASPRKMAMREGDPAPSASRAAAPNACRSTADPTARVGSQPAAIITAGVASRLARTDFAKLRPASPTAPARQRLHSRCARHFQHHGEHKASKSPWQRTLHRAMPPPPTTAALRTIRGSPSGWAAAVANRPPAGPDRAIQTPSATAGQNTCTSDTPTLEQASQQQAPAQTPQTASARCTRTPCTAPRPPPQPPVPRPAPRPGRGQPRNTTGHPGRHHQQHSPRLQLHATALTPASRPQAPNSNTGPQPSNDSNLVEERGSGVRL